MSLLQETFMKTTDLGTSSPVSEGRSTLKVSIFIQWGQGAFLGRAMRRVMRFVSNSKIPFLPYFQHKRWWLQNYPTREKKKLNYCKIIKVTKNDSAEDHKCGKGLVESTKFFFLKKIKIPSCTYSFLVSMLKSTWVYIGLEGNMGHVDGSYIGVWMISFRFLWSLL